VIKFYENHVKVDAPGGTLLGEKFLVESKEIFSFKGIPYGVPPTGERRWRHAEFAAKWEGERVATSYGPDCIQPLFSETSLYYQPASLQSEDCLYLNIWTPVLGNQETVKLPVMVWIHGGALLAGSGSLALYDGVELARKGTVIVTFNYRLGIFGFFVHPSLSEESPLEVSGNYGLTDQILVLKWLRKNISAFGGDPENVTIFGESAGGWSVSLLMTSPMAKGLFNKAIAQSNAHFYPLRELKSPYMNKISAESAGYDCGKKIGANSIEDLRNLPAHKLLNIATKYWSISATEYPVVDNEVIPGQVYEIFSQGKQHDVPVLLGLNAEDGSVFSELPESSLERMSDRVGYVEDINSRYGKLANEYLKIYPSSSLQNSIYNSFRDANATWGIQTWAQTMEKLHANVFLYYFSHTLRGAEAERPVPPGCRNRPYGAFHTSEISYVFNNEKHGFRYSSNMPVKSASEADVMLADLMSSCWVNFAANGNPSRTEEEWKPYCNDYRNYMEFNNGSCPKKDLLSGAWELWDQINRTRREKKIFWNADQTGPLGNIIG
jgi:para-nitrobenzyl esterase